MSPEVIQKLNFDYRVDIWSLGVIFYELLHGKVPFEGNSIQEKCENIISNPIIKYDYQISDKAKDLLEKCLKKKPNERIEFHEIFNHSWVQTFEKILNINMKNYLYNNDMEMKEGDEQESKMNILIESPAFEKKKTLQINLSLINRKNQKSYQEDSENDATLSHERNIPQEFEKKSYFINFFLMINDVLGLVRKKIEKYIPSNKNDSIYQILSTKNSNEKNYGINFLFLNKI